MCRLFGFRSSIVSRAHHSLVQAENALAAQSEQHRDGWGIAHYVDNYPHIIRNDQQALIDSLYQDVSAVVATRTFVAHIRRATVGDINVLNCHPFQHGGWTFAHNGEVAGYREDPRIAERVRDRVDERFRRHILGTTDSETVFHIFLSHLGRSVENIQDPGISTPHVVKALRRTVEEVIAVSDGTPEKPTKLSMLVSNGHVLVGYRRKIPIYLSTYKTLCPERDSCHAYEEARCEREVKDGIVKHLLVASEIISGTNVWLELAEDEYVSVDHAMNFRRGQLVS